MKKNKIVNPQNYYVYTKGGKWSKASLWSSDNGIKLSDDNNFEFGDGDFTIDFYISPREIIELNDFMKKRFLVRQ